MNDDIKVRGNGKHLCSSNGASRSTGCQRSSCRRSAAPISVQMDVAYNLSEKTNKGRWQKIMSPRGENDK